MTDWRPSIRQDFVLAVVMVVTLLTVSPSASAAFKYLQEGMKAPPVEGRDVVSGEEIDSKPTGENAVLIVTFWATWSKRSLELLTDLKTIKEENQDHPLRIIAINVEGMEISPDTIKSIESQIAGMELPFPVIIDKNLSTFYAFGVIAVPSTAILDAQGLLRYAPSGYSYSIRDRIADSTDVLLGIKPAPAMVEFTESYTPTNESSRYYRLGLQMARQGLYDRAMVHIERSIEADPEFSAPHNLKGQILLEMHEPEVATPEFEAAVQKNESSVAAWAGWGRALREQGQIPAAREKLEKALSLDDAYTPALLDMGLCLAAEGYHQGAIDVLIAARDLNPMNPQTHFRIGEVYQLTDRTPEAVAAYQAALEILFPSP